jgi:anti-sigma factor RsiW
MSRHPAVHAPAPFRQPLLCAMPRLRRYACSLVSEAPAADDLVQTKLERALTNWYQYDQRRGIVVWLVGLAHHDFVDDRRRHHRLRVVDPEEAAAAADVWRHESATDVALRMDLAAAAAPSAWVQRAAPAYRVYTAEKRHPVEVNRFTTAAEQRAEQEARLQRWLTRRVDRPVKLFDLGAHGFEPVGGRLLPDGPNGVSALLMYERPDGPRVTGTLRRAGETVPATFRYVQRDGLGQFYRVEGQAGYALAGPLPREQLLTLARAIYAQQPAGRPPPKR